VNDFNNLINSNLNLDINKMSPQKIMQEIKQYSFNIHSPYLRESYKCLRNYRDEYKSLSIKQKHLIKNSVFTVQQSTNYETLLSSFKKAISAQHDNYLSITKNSNFKPNKKRIRTIHNVSKMTTQICNTNFDPEKKVKLLMGLLESNRKSVLYHQEKKDFLAIIGKRSKKQDSRLISVYDKIIEKAKDWDINIEDSVELFNDTFPQYAQNLDIKLK
jgi:hypothetical protein